MSSATSTIPVCTTCAPSASCCIFTTTACIPTPAKEIKTVEELLETDPFAQILHVMCIHGFLWNPCGGPRGSTNVGFTFDGLLAELQSVFRDSNWNATDLTDFLTVGISQGLFKKLASDETYYAYQNLLNVNPKNWIYEDVCDQLCAKKQCKAPSSLGGTFC